MEVEALSLLAEALENQDHDGPIRGIRGRLPNPNQRGVAEGEAVQMAAFSHLNGDDETVEKSA